MKIRILMWLMLVALVYCLMETMKLKGDKIVFCDVGQGDAILIKTEGRKILLDTGPKNGKVFECLAKNMPFWNKTLDLLIISHYDNDHSANLEEIRHVYEVKKVIDNKNTKEGGEIFLGEDKMVVLNSGGEDNNSSSLVIDLKMKERKILLTGDADLEVENRMVWRKIINGRYDILKVSHHGSETATGEELMKIIRPKMAIISVGKNNYGHPKDLILERLKRWQSKIYRTDQWGDVVINF